MTSADVHTLVGAYVLDAVDASERSAVAEHLDACAACADEVVELQVLAAVLAADAAEPPPASLRAAVMAQVAVTRQLPPTVRDLSQPAPQPHPQPDPQPRAQPPHPPAAPAYTGSGTGTRAGAGRQARRLSRALTVAAAGLAVVSAGLGAVVVDQQRELDAARGRSELLESLSSAAVDGRAASPVAGGGRIAVVGVNEVAPAAALVVLRGLPDLPPGRTYQLWVLGEHAPRPAGTLAGGDESDRVVRTSAMDTAVALTVEPDGGSLVPTDPILASVPLRT